MSASAEPGVATVHGGTRVLGVIGWPVAHSLSPVIHNAAFRALAMDRVYVPLPVEPDGLARAIEGLRSLGFEGANVTMPHKEQSADLADELSDDARLLHAVNTLVLSERTVMGENTDVIGFERFLRDDTEFDPDGAEALILGAGGAARAVALALARCGASSVTVAVRDIAGAAALVEMMDGTACAGGACRVPGGRGTHRRSGRERHADRQRRAFHAAASEAGRGPSPWWTCSTTRPGRRGGRPPNAPARGRTEGSACSCTRPPPRSSDGPVSTRRWTSCRPPRSIALSHRG